VGSGITYLPWQQQEQQASSIKHQAAKEARPQASLSSSLFSSCLFFIIFFFSCLSHCSLSLPGPLLSIPSPFALVHISALRIPLPASIHCSPTPTPTDLREYYVQQALSVPAGRRCLLSTAVLEPSGCARTSPLTSETTRIPRWLKQKLAWLHQRAAPSAC
jgi:hypothetical protein